jgi:hypothetical protein
VAATARAEAPVAAVWPLVGEAHRWKDWSFVTRSGLERSGRPAPDGVGAVRRFSRMGIGSREEVLAWDPPRHLAYTVLAGFPVRNHRSDVLLTPEGNGTLISWSATFDEMVPGTGRLMEVVLSRLVHGFATAAAAYAGRHPDPDPSH